MWYLKHTRHSTSDRLLSFPPPLPGLGIRMPLSLSPTVSVSSSILDKSLQEFSTVFLLTSLMSNSLHWVDILRKPYPSPKPQYLWMWPFLDKGSLYMWLGEERWNPAGFRVDPGVNDRFSYKRKGRPCEDGGRDWVHAPSNRGIATIAHSPQKLD